MAGPLCLPDSGMSPRIDEAYSCIGVLAALTDPDDPLLIRLTCAIFTSSY